MSDAAKRAVDKAATNLALAVREYMLSKKQPEKSPGDLAAHCAMFGMQGVWDLRGGLVEHSDMQIALGLILSEFTAAFPAAQLHEIVDMIAKIASETPDCGGLSVQFAGKAN